MHKHIIDRTAVPVKSLYSSYHALDCHKKHRHDRTMAHIRICFKDLDKYIPQQING